MRSTITILLIAFHLPTYASDESFNWLKSTSGENSALSGKCNYLGNSSDMNCNLRQLSIRKKITETSFNKQVENSITELNNEMKGETIDSYVKKIYGDICNQLSPVMKSSMRGTEIIAYNNIETLCKKPTKKKLLNIYMESLKQERDTCKVFEYDTGNFEFEQVNSNKWVSTNKPSGECSVVSILTLERNPESSFLWRYNQVKHYTNTATKLCKSLADNVKPMSYSWNGKSPLEMNCKYIEFGL
tara:strand:+ start:8431 stop:9162 length:732 start_codon:yes stop_codon:yes gene_type:complete